MTQRKPPGTRTSRGTETRQRPHSVHVRLSGHEHALVSAAMDRTGLSAPELLREAFLASYREIAPEGGRPGRLICPREQHRGRWPDGVPLDRYTDGSGWSCPGVAADGSACGYERPASLVAAVAEIGGSGDRG